METRRFAATRFGYDLRDLQTARIRPKGTRWDYGFDGAGRLTTVDMPSSGRTTYVYDKNSNLEQMIDAEQKTTNFSFDALDRRVAQTVPGRGDAQIADQLESLTWRWDANNNLILVQERYSESGEHTTVRTYDAFDRLETLVDRLGRDIAYTYDPNGNRASLSAPDQSTTYRFDGLNRVKEVIGAAGLTSYRYYRNSQLQEIRYPNGSVASYTYDIADRLTSIENVQGSVTVSSYAYTFDDNGNRTSQTEFQVGRGGEVTTYRYDGSDRLLEAAYPDQVVTYTYDLVGNRIGEDVSPAGGGAVERKTYAYNSRDQLESISHTLDPSQDVAYTFDANGNQISKTKAGERSDFVFDTLDRLVRVEQGGVPRGYYLYDFQDLRIQKQTATGQVQYLYDDQSVLQRHDSQLGQIEYDYGPDRLLSVDHPTDGRAFYLFDGLGSIVGLTTAGGSLLAQSSYDAWGSTRYQAGTDTNIFGFTGHEGDSESRLIYAKARYYDAETARFLSHDPEAGNTESPPSLHRYLYAFQNPTAYIDPDGREGEPVNPGRESLPLSLRFDTPPEDDELELEEPPEDEPSPLDRAIAFFDGLFTSDEKARDLDESFDEARSTRRSTEDVLAGRNLEEQVAATGRVLEDTAELGVAVVEDTAAATDVVGVAAVGKTAGKRILTKRSRRAQQEPKSTALEETSETVREISSPVLDKPRAGNALKLDRHHAFPDLVDNFTGDAHHFVIPTRGPGGQIVRQSELFQIEGSLNGREGVFEWIVDRRKVTHRRFIPSGEVTGFPNQIPKGKK